MKNNTRRVFLRNTSLAATGVMLVSPLGATNKKVRNSASLGCAPMSFKSVSGTLASVKSGNWSDPATWGGRTPGLTDVVDISSGHVVSYDLAQASIAGLNIGSSASLVFDPSKNTVLESSGNIINEGLLQMIPSSQSIVHTLRFIKVVEANFVGGGMNVLSTDVGLWVMNNGQLDLQGATKTSWTRALDTILGGTSNISLLAPPQGWAVGDQLITSPTVTPTTANFSSAFDDNQIKSISGSSVAISTPMVYTHPKVNGQWTAEVINVTRNVRIEGTPLGRSHIFIRSGKPQTLRHVQIRHMGPRKDMNNDRLDELVLGRYALHFHHSMDGSRGSIVEGCVIRDTGNHCYVPHVSHGIVFKNNVAYNVTESAFWWDETDSSHDIVWDGNIVALCKFVPHSVNVHAQFNPGSFSPTLSASGFLIGRGDDNIVMNNVVVGSWGDPGNGAAYNWEANSEGVWKFENNMAHNCDCGIRVWQVTNRHHFIKDFTAYYNATGIFHGAYANSYKYSGGQLYGNAFAIKAACIDTNRVRVENMIIDGAGIIDHCVRNLGSPLAGVVGNLLLNCTIRGSKKEAVVNENFSGNLVKGLDVVLCNVAGAISLPAGVAPLEYIRIQNASGQSTKITPLGQSSIPNFASTFWGTGNGLAGQYFNRHDFTNYVFTRNDYNISFTIWGTEDVHYKITSKSYAIRWTGQIQAQFTENHIIKVRTAGGFKLWIDNQLIAEHDEAYPSEYASKPLAWETGKKYDIKLEYYNIDSMSGIELLWESPSLPLEYVPQSQLYAGITTNPPAPVTNQPPVANAGADIIVSLPITAGVVLNGSATDVDGTVNTYKWTKVSGPTSVSFSDDAVPSPTVKDLFEGVYIFRLTVTDDKGLAATDDIQVTVKPAATTTKTVPVANAGADLVITLPTSTVILTGSGSDPDGNPLTYAWTKVSGSGGTLVNDNTATATVTNLKAGSYVFRLAVTDIKGGTASDDVEVTVNSAITTNDGTGSGNNNTVNSNGSTESGSNTGSTNSPGETQRVNQTAPATLELTAWPNPSPSTFTLKVKSSSTQPISINIYNRWGKLEDSFRNVANGSNLTVGSGYKKGIYYAHMVQGATTETLRLVKLL